MPLDKVTVPEIRARKAGGPKIAMLTAYDATIGRLLDEGGADILLVGDSLGMVVQGLPNTLPSRSTRSVTTGARWLAPLGALRWSATCRS
jgi:ketopantoate hydroxymethyltransferase